MSKLEKFSNTIEELEKELIKLKDTSEAYQKLQVLTTAYTKVNEQFEQNSNDLKDFLAKQQKKQDELVKSLALLYEENKDFKENIENKLDENQSEIQQLIAGERPQIGRLIVGERPQIKRLIEDERPEIKKLIEGESTKIKKLIEGESTKIKELIEDENTKIKEIFETLLSEKANEITSKNDTTIGVIGVISIAIQLIILFRMKV